MPVPPGTPGRVERAIEKARALVEAHRYIQRFVGKVVVVKVGGSVQEDDEKLRALLTDVSFMSAVGMRPVLVHGGGKKITQAMNEAGLQARFIAGRRYTDRATLDIAERVLVNDINKELVRHLNDAGCKAIGLTSLGSCVLFADRMHMSDRETGEEVDLGYVGQVTEVNTVLLNALCEDGYVPVIAPVAMSRDTTAGVAGEAGGPARYNVNADTAAARVAAAMKAEKLVICSDIAGIMRDVDDPSSCISTMTPEEIERLIDEGVIAEGMLPKVDACLIALEGEVPKAHIIDGRLPHSVLLEIYTDEGIGTQITLQAQDVGK